MTHSTQSLSAAKPAKPYKDFPLFPHATRRWAKKIRGKVYYFGPWDDPDGALERYQAERDDLYAGRTPRARLVGLTVADLCNYFLTSRTQLMTAGELTLRSWTDYRRTTDRLVRVFGKHRLVSDLAGDDFARLRADIAKKRGPVATKTEIVRTRAVFHFGFKHGLTEKPVRFGAGFEAPRQATLRKASTAHGPRMFTADELRNIIGACPTATLKAMVLIACNSGMGNHDIGLLNFEALDLAGGWIDFPRTKTGAPRRFPLWPETVAAIRESLVTRPQPAAGHESYVFLTRKRHCWSKQTSAAPLAREFKKVLTDAGITRPNAGFYDLRRTFQTIAEEAGETATKVIMGHCDNSMSARYRQQISDERLRAVVEHVRTWLLDQADVKEGGAA